MPRRKVDSLNLKDMAFEFKTWADMVPVEDLARLVVDAFWKHDEPFEKSDLVRYFLLERNGQRMLPRSHERIEALAKIRRP